MFFAPKEFFFTVLSILEYMVLSPRAGPPLEVPYPQSSAAPIRLFPPPSLLLFPPTCLSDALAIFSSPTSLMTAIRSHSSFIHSHTKPGVSLSDCGTPGTLFCTMLTRPSSSGQCGATGSDAGASSRCAR